jgi:hypothetical protein
MARLSPEPHGNAGVGLARLEAVEIGRMPSARLCVGHALKAAVMALAQRRLRHHRLTARHGDAPGSDPGAGKIRTVDRIDAHVFQRLRRGVGLQQAVIVERNVELTLDASIDVPGGFAVANEAEAGRGRHGRSLCDDAL